MPTTRKRPSIEKIAAEMTAHLNTTIGTSQLDPNATLLFIFRLIREEGQYMREAGPCSVLMYRDYVKFAISHLEKHPDPVRKTEFEMQVIGDLGICGSVMKKLPTCCFTQEERGLMIAAINEMTKLLFIRLQ